MLCSFGRSMGGPLDEKNANPCLRMSTIYNEWGRGYLSLCFVCIGKNVKNGTMIINIFFANKSTAVTPRLDGTLGYNYGRHFDKVSTYIFKITQIFQSEFHRANYSQLSRITLYWFVFSRSSSLLSIKLGIIVPSWLRSSFSSNTFWF